MWEQRRVAPKDLSTFTIESAPQLVSSASLNALYPWLSGIFERLRHMGRSFSRNIAWSIASEKFVTLLRTAELTLDSRTGAAEHMTSYLMAGYPRGLGGDGVSSLGFPCGSVEITQYRDVWVNLEPVVNADNIVSSIMDGEEA